MYDLLLGNRNFDVMRFLDLARGQRLSSSQFASQFYLRANGGRACCVWSASRTAPLAPSSAESAALGSLPRVRTVGPRIAPGRASAGRAARDSLRSPRPELRAATFLDTSPRESSPPRRRSKA